MRCPYCASDETQVRDSRPAEDGTSIRRRRVCGACGARFTTFERVQLRELVVVKRSGRKVPFDRDKLERSVGTATRKRDIPAERVEQMISGVIRRLEQTNEGEVTTEQVGEAVLEGLRELDTVAYVRFLSVYREFSDAHDFKAVLDDLDDQR